MPTNFPSIYNVDSTSTSHLIATSEWGKKTTKSTLFLFFLLSVEDMIKEVDVDGDGRIDFYGKISSALYIAAARFREKRRGRVKKKFQFLFPRDPSSRWSIVVVSKREGERKGGNKSCSKDYGRNVHDYASLSLAILSNNSSLFARKRMTRDVSCYSDISYLFKLSLVISEFVHALGEPGIDEDEEDDDEDLQSPLF